MALRAACDTGCNSVQLLELLWPRDGHHILLAHCSSHRRRRQLRSHHLETLLLQLGQPRRLETLHRGQPRRLQTQNPLRADQCPSQDLVL